MKKDIFKWKLSILCRFFTIEIIETANAGFIKMFLSQNFIVGYLNISILSEYACSSCSFLYEQECNSLT